MCSNFSHKKKGAHLLRNPDSWIPGDFGKTPFHCTVGVADECRNLGHLQQQGSYCCESGVVAKGYLADVS